MDEGKFIICRNCAAVHHVTPFDKAPSYFLPGGTGGAIPEDDRQAFLARHAGHRLEALRAVEESVASGEAAGDPMAVAYLEVTDGRRTLLLRRFRRSIDEPVQFEPVAGRLGEPVTTLEIQAREIRKELKRRFRADPGGALSDAKIDHFVTIFHQEVANLDPQSVSVGEPSYEDNGLSYVNLSAGVKEALMKKCAGLFTLDELDALRRFVDAQGEDAGVMTLALRRRIAAQLAG